MRGLRRQASTRRAVGARRGVAAIVRDDGWTRLVTRGSRLLSERFCCDGDLEAKSGGPREQGFLDIDIGCAVRKA